MIPEFWQGYIAGAVSVVVVVFVWAAISLFFGEPEYKVRIKEIEKEIAEDE